MDRKSLSRPRRSGSTRSVNLLAASGNNSINDSDIDITPFNIRWLEISILIVMWVHKYCPRCIELFGSIIQIILSWIYVYITYNDLNNSSSLIKFATSEYAIFFILTIAFWFERMLILYYFTIKYKTKPYPWNNITNRYHIGPLSNYYKKSVKYTCFRCLFGFIIFVTLMCIHSFCNYDKEKDKDTIWIIIDITASLYGIYIPIGLSQCVLSFILLKYQLYLHTISVQFDNHNNIDFINDGNDIDIDQIFRRYKQLYKSFMDQYEIWKYIISIQILISFCVLWICIDAIVETNHFWHHWKMILWTFTGFYYFIPLIEFVYIASMVNSKSDDLLQKLWDFSFGIKVCRDDGINVNPNHLKFQTYFQYVRFHEFTVKIMGIKVTLSNVCKYLIVFIVAKVISYTIYNVNN